VPSYVKQLAAPALKIGDLFISDGVRTEEGHEGVKRFGTATTNRQSMCEAKARVKPSSENAQAVNRESIFGFPVGFG
jgi:hypothetical protein